MSRRSLAIFLWMIIPALIQAQNVYNQALVDTLAIGDVIDYSIIINRDRDYSSILLPDSTEFGEQFLLRSVQRFRLNDYKDSVYYQLQFFGTESGFIPNVPVGFVEKTDTSYVLVDKVPFEYRSSIDSEEDPLRPYKPIFDFARNWLLIIVLTLLLVIAVYYAYKLMKKRAEERPKEESASEEIPTFLNPLDVLESSLVRLGESKALRTGSYKEFYVKLSGAIRQYFERAYQIKALEETTRDIIRDLDAKMMDKEIISLTRTILREADMVKFARFQPTLDAAHNALDQARLFVKRARMVDRSLLERMRKEHEQKFQRSDGEGESS